MDPAISGERGHDALLKVATALVVGFTLTDEQAMEILADYNERCEPPWSRKELEHKVSEARQNKLGLEPGYLLKSDGRAATSPRNGAQGGRPKVEVAVLAHDLVNFLFKRDGVVTLRHYHGQWYVYDGGYYRQVPESDVQGWVMAYLQNYELEQNPTRNLRDNMIANLLAMDLCLIPSKAPTPCWLHKAYDAAEGWTAMANMAVNVAALARRLGGAVLRDCDVFQPLTPRLFVTHRLSYSYSGQAQCPKFLRYLADVQPDPADQGVLQMLFGLSLIPETRYNVAFLFFGEGGTGKSVMLTILVGVVGSENVCCVPLACFAQRFQTQPLVEKLLNVVGDMPTASDYGSMETIEGVFKDVCGGGIIKVEMKFQHPVDAPATARNVFATNSLPRFCDRSRAVWDRLRIIPFDVVFRGTASECPSGSALYF
jgi:hypothetical protein